MKHTCSAEINQDKSVFFGYREVKFRKAEWPLRPKEAFVPIKAQEIYPNLWRDHLGDDDSYYAHINSGSNILWSFHQYRKEVKASIAKRRKELGRTSVRFLLFLIESYQPCHNNPNIFVKNKTIAKKFGLSVRSIQMLFRQLIDAGEIENTGFTAGGVNIRKICRMNVWFETPKAYDSPNWHEQSVTDAIPVELFKKAVAGTAGRTNRTCGDLIAEREMKIVVNNSSKFKQITQRQIK